MKYINNPAIGEFYVIDIITYRAKERLEEQMITELVDYRQDERFAGRLVFKILMSNVQGCWYPGEELALYNDTTVYLNDKNVYSIDLTITKLKE